MAPPGLERWRGPVTLPRVSPWAMNCSAPSGPLDSWSQLHCSSAQRSRPNSPCIRCAAPATPPPPKTSAPTSTWARASTVPLATARAKPIGTPRALRKSTVSPLRISSPSYAQPATRTRQGDSSPAAHGELVQAMERGPNCGTCHDVHRVRSILAMKRRCTNCHQERPEACSGEPAESTFKLDCANCHTPHEFQP